MVRWTSESKLIPSAWAGTALWSSREESPFCLLNLSGVYTEVEAGACTGPPAVGLSQKQESIALGMKRQMENRHLPPWSHKER